jgi:hypothetical protein
MHLLPRSVDSYSRHQAEARAGGAVGGAINYFGVSFNSLPPALAVST